MSEHPVQIVTVPRCPACRCIRVPRYASAGQLQYRKCLKCNTRFKTFKKFASLPDIGKQ